MVYDGNNYAIQHSPLFYICFVAVMITATALMLGLFLLMVGRTSAATKADPAPGAADTTPGTVPDTTAGTAPNTAPVTTTAATATAPAA